MVNKAANIRCDVCGFTFRYSTIKIKKQKVRDDIEQTYFLCPKCKKKYVVITTDTAIRKLIRKCKEMYPKGFAKGITSAECAKKINEHNAMREEIKRRSRELANTIK